MKKVLLSLVFTLSLFVVPSFQSSSFAQQMTLVQEGKPNAQIVISANPSTTERYVANDLQQIIQKISGAELPVKNTVDKSTFNIVIGTPQSIPEIKSASLFDKDINPETIRIATREKVLFLAGNTPGAALRAVYTLLQNQLDCRWFWPGETGEYLPTQKTISLEQLDITEIPDIRDRSLSINAPHWDDDTVVWMSRNRMNWHHLQGSKVTERNIKFLHERGIKAVVGGHNITLPREVLEKHPEYVAMYGGKRQLHPSASHLCWSNEGVQKAVAEKVEKWWTDNPEVDSISFLAADQTHFCECDQCKIMAPDVSTRWQKFVEIIIDEVSKKHPQKHYQALAYQAYRNVPTHVAPLDLIGYTTYNINYTKPISDASNEKARQEIEDWQKAGGNMGIRGYQFIPFKNSMYAPITPLIMEEVAWAHQIGLKGWKSELRPYGHPKDNLPQDQNWVTHRMALYAVAQAMWDSSQKPVNITRDWSQHIFGPAAELMFNYYTAMQKAWVESPKPLTYFLQPPASFVKYFISDDLLKNAAQNFQKAQSEVNKIDDSSTKNRITDQIKLEATLLDAWREIYLLQQGRMGRFNAEAPRIITPPQMTANADDPAWKNIAPIPHFEDKDRNPAPEKTDAYLQWDADALYLRFVNHDDNIAELKTTQMPHDGGIFGDDAIEFFLNNPAAAGHYFHMVINAQNTSYDAKVDSAMNMDKSWNPKFVSKTSVGKDSWILDVKLPFKEFGIKGKEGSHWEMSFKRNGAKRRDATGWPDASYHNPAGFGKVIFVDKVAPKKQVLIYNSGQSRDALLASFREQGFTVLDVLQNEDDFKSTFNNDIQALILYAHGMKDFELSDQTMTELVKPFVENGGMVIAHGYGNKPLDKWFGADFAAKWDGWKIDTNRKSTFVAEGNWQTVPNDLSRALQRSTTPASGFTPQSDKWEVLAKIRMQDGSESAYLLRQKLGKGEIILTSSAFGYGGGHEIFGNMNPKNVVNLVDNLLADLRTD